LGKGSAQQALSSLLAGGHVLDDDGSARVTDPFLADWLRATHPL